MLFFATLAISTTEIPRILPRDAKYFPQEWQTALMDQFYVSVSKDGKMGISKGNVLNDYCNWTGVSCDSGIVTDVQYNNRQFGDFNIHVLPSTVETLNIQSSRQTYAFQTRALPRELIVCVLNNNCLFGSADLRTLPTKLICLNISSNKLTGSIELTSLPCNLERLYVHCNFIAQPVVLYDRLPPKAIAIQIVSEFSRTNQIGKVCSVRPDMAVENKAVFWPIPAENVR